MRSLSANIVAGFEANGGFLLQTPVERGGRRLEALPTRDAAIVHLALLQRGVERDLPLSQLLQELPRRFTFSDRLRDFPPQLGRRLMDELGGKDGTAALEPIEKLLGPLFGRPLAADATDGVRITFSAGEIVHLRPSGNAPELRCYSEADDEARAREICVAGLDWVKKWRRREERR